ncbi:hypothetical protein EMIHUDRAFT_355364, partial [Emiliania huxleyi CCMP1516]|uniref:Uncharacterized protein n=2 Tax=Emiliania huxleyi TaxID=2903 RepID=A0A0D3J7J5_EMIH1
MVARKLRANALRLAWQEPLLLSAAAPEPTAESKVAECVPEEERPLLERLAAAAQLHDDLKAELHAELRLGEPESSKRLTAAHSKEPHSCAPPSITAAAKRVAAASSKAEKSDRGDLRSDLRSEIRSEIKSEIKSDAKSDAKGDKPPPAKKAPPRLARPARAATHQAAAAAAPALPASVQQAAAAAAATAAAATAAAAAAVAQQQARNAALEPTIPQPPPALVAAAAPAPVAPPPPAVAVAPAPAPAPAPGPPPQPNMAAIAQNMQPTMARLAAARRWLELRARCSTPSTRRLRRRRCRRRYRRCRRQPQRRPNPEP